MFPHHDRVYRIQRAGGYGAFRCFVRPVLSVLFFRHKCDLTHYVRSNINGRLQGSGSAAEYHQSSFSPVTMLNNISTLLRRRLSGAASCVFPCYALGHRL